MKEKKFHASSIPVYLILIIWALTTIYPLVWVVQNSFKGKDKILSQSFSLPLGDLFTTANYQKAFSNLNIFGAYKNSIVISCSVALFVIVFAGMAAFGLVRYQFRLRGFLQSLVVAAMMFPVYATIIPVFTMEAGWGITNTPSWSLTMLSVTLPQIAGNMAFAIVVLTGYRDIDYAQTAIKLGVARYLLKPSKMEELDEAIAFMTGRLDELKESGRYIEDKVKKEETISIEESEQSLAEEDSTASSFIVKNAITYIEEHYQEKLKLSDVAEQVYVSQWHLSKLLNKYQGRNFSEILNGVRIAKAMELLKDPSLRIGDIADEVGFLDMAHFSRVFKKIVGISANEYRNQL